ncbi:probable G-protein coupled receptor 139 [Hemiscyllium ocellatum]|uniref:probable G-protein coupled receptor 139 n=1 Tax=Hemiscyllium ocellatum TaxID=170820 RepID=UPI00296722E1|nr:probable G-protein coupled receptor 139 [Hemiscyllium ocellatum]
MTCYLVATAVADFFAIVFGCILNRISGIYFRYSILSTTPLCSLSLVLIRCTRDVSVWLTVAFTFDRFIAICCQSRKANYCTERNASLVTGIVCALSCIKDIPFYFIFKPLYILEGVAWFCDIKMPFYTLPVWQVYHWMDRILTPFLPFFLILLLNVLTVRHILMASKARQRLLGAKNCGDAEMENRKRSIVLLFAISFSFLLLWATYVGHFLYVQVTGEGYYSGQDSTDLRFILQESANMFQLLNSCNNVFIYVISQNKFREELKKLLLCPFMSCTRCFKR